MPTFDPRDFYYKLKAWNKFPLAKPTRNTRNWGHDFVEGSVLSAFFPLSCQLADLRATGQHSKARNDQELGLSVDRDSLASGKLPFSNIHPQMEMLR